MSYGKKIKSKKLLTICNAMAYFNGTLPSKSTIFIFNLFGDQESKDFTVEKVILS